MPKSIKLKNDTYWDTSGISHNKKKLNEVINGNNTFMIITGDRIIGDTKYVGKLGMGADKSIALEISTDGNILGRIAIMSDGTIKNYVSGKRLLESGYETITADEFLTNVTGCTINECLVYRCGNILNIQRLVISGITKVTSPKVIANVVGKYKPCGNRAVRFAGSDGNNNINTTLFINGSDGSLNYQATTNDGATYTVYVFNISYVIK